MPTARSYCHHKRLTTYAKSKSTLRPLGRTQSQTAPRSTASIWTSATILSSRCWIEGRRQKICMKKRDSNRNYSLTLEAKVIIAGDRLKKRTVWWRSYLGLKIAEKNTKNSSKEAQMTSHWFLHQWPINSNKQFKNTLSQFNKSRRIKILIVLRHNTNKRFFQASWLVKINLSVIHFQATTSQSNFKMIYAPIQCRGTRIWLWKSPDWKLRIILNKFKRISSWQLPLPKPLGPKGERLAQRSSSKVKTQKKTHSKRVTPLISEPILKL